jgi:hypothetical protein
MIKMRKLLSIMLALSLLILSSCHTTKQAKKAINKVMKYHPEVVANVCMDSFPCITSKIDTVTYIEYEFVELQCPGYEIDKKDTIYLTKNKTNIITGPAVVVIKNKTNEITKLVRDSAAIKLCKLEVIKLNEKCKELTLQNVKLQNKVTAKNRWIMWLIIALLCSILCNVIQFKK